MRGALGHGATRTVKRTVPVPPEDNDPPNVQTIEPLPFTAGCVVTVQLESAAGRGAPQLADWKVVKAGVVSVTAIDETEPLPELV